MPTDSGPSIAISGLSHRYGEKVAIDDLSLEIPRRSIFGVLGPNGSGKSTLFRLLSTLVPVQSGTIRMLGYDVSKDQQAIRERIGVVFQSPSLDRKLTARENILFQAALYSIPQSQARARVAELSKALGIEEQLDIKIDKLSGGLRRRVELVKGLLHQPELLLLDEPSTGLDPLSRLELWHSLEQLRLEHSTTIVLTTHLLEEAEKCDRIAILDHGRLLVDDSPEALRTSTGQIVFSVATNEPHKVIEQLEKQYGFHGSFHGGSVRIVRQQTDISPMEVYASLGSLVSSMTIGPPSLEDVFLRLAGKSFS
ncbi:MAG: ABC transporter ATP-binding protein [Planctomycetota bacterium]|nr:ABC transporter ATP-binding protein [Planctomycetota bacterium]